MDLLKVSKKDYSIGALVEVEPTGTIIWTERFQVPGELELHTNAVQSVRKALPEMSLVTLRDTNEVIMIESHEIQPDDDGVNELIVRGRTLDFFPENRVWK